MKTYKVAVGNKEYIVKLEEIDGNSITETTVSEPAVSDTTKAVPTGDSEMINAPLQGTILRVDIEPGQTVKTSDTVLIIEAMKLENEVVAPRDGVVDQVFIKEGQTVNAGEALYSLK